MTADGARAERRAEVRAAARAWREAGLVDRAAVDRVDAAFPDDRRRASPAFRVLLGAFSLVGVLATFGFLALLARSVAPAVLLGPLSWVAADLLVRRGRRAGGGLEEGLGLAANLLVLIAAGWTLDEVLRLRGEEVLVQAVLAAAVALAVASCWRWGMPAYGPAGAVAFFLLLAQGPAGPAAWAALPLALAWPLDRARRSATLAPSIRAAAGGVLAVSLGALAAVVNHALADRGFVAGLAAGRGGSSAGWAGWWTVLATAALPPVLLALGVRRRDRLLLAAGVVAAAASLVTLRVYVHLAPLWALLAGSGAALVGLGLGIGRLLGSGPGRERVGLTAEPLFTAGERARVLEIAAAIVALSPAPQPAPEERLEPGGGRFGGGGASGGF